MSEPQQDVSLWCRVMWRMPACFQTRVLALNRTNPSMKMGLQQRHLLSGVVDQA